MAYHVLTHTFFPIVGGAEVGIHEIFKRFPVEPKVSIVTPIPAAGAGDFTADDLTRDASYEVVRLRDTPRGDSVFAKVGDVLAWRQIRYLWRHRSTAKQDTVNLHYAFPHGFAAIAARLLGYRVVIALVGRTDVLSEIPWWMRAHAELALRAAHQVITISEFDTQRTRWSSRATVIPYGADAAYFQAPDARAVGELRASWDAEGRTVLLAVQRLAPVKAVDKVIEAVRVLAADEPDRYRLVIVGRGSEMERLRRLAEGLEETVRFVGYVSEEDLPAHYAAADVFVSHSMYETFGVMFAQAMASGKPIVAARTSCISEVVPHGEVGLLVEPGDTAGFAAAVSRITDDAALRDRLGAAGRARAEARYRWEDVASAYETALRR
ncbi:glycosyltransferase family 4 protein [Demequina sp. NBRC 110052]|uniref:glycosyltransferase family 4 protein n=1 Tax=Demequina sp. NBRC 110052 TaxID=1570341 RepID=UPI0013564054|nr:glycosyltransferase family 4 protein [Demequina sp. NBRC 110052]